MFIADFHIHSRYSRATSKECVPEMLELWARRKGLDLIGTGDFTHPAWREELKEKLVPAEEGLYTLKEDFRQQEDIAEQDSKPRFIVSGEISSIYKKNGRVRKVHNVILLPSLEAAETLAHRLEAIGNVHSDGRPILGLDSRDLLEIALETAPDVIFIPAHIWTPHFSLFGAYSGFDNIQECFEDLTEHIHALETGLSSDPPMNWRLSALDRFALVSNSDAHSPANLAREANFFDTELSYPHIAQALENRDTNEFCGTLEFFPQEGKYHYDGHRNCKVCQKPAETIAASGICPVCGGRITVGVLHRVETLADRDEGFRPEKAKLFENLIPLHEVIASSMGLTTASMKVKEKHRSLIHSLGPELFILRAAPLADIERHGGALLAEAIRRLREGKVDIRPGYDGEYGKIQVIDKSEIERLSGQISFINPVGEGKPSSKDILSPESQADSSPDVDQIIKEVPATQAANAGALDGFNPQQWEAVSAAQRAVAVVAGPGTGKTKTLVGRIAYLVENCGVSPFRITAVTFTNKAAGEIRARLEQHFGSKRLVRSLNIGTFHSICLWMLQQNGKTVTVIDESSALSLLRDILKELGLKQSPRDVLRGISLLKNGASPEENAVLPEVYDAYNAQLAQYGVLDYDDILLRVLKDLESRDLKEDKSILNAFSHLLVDEFQDINAVQYRLIRAWTQNSEGVFVIGDPDQSIYGFRGSDPRCFQQFLEAFAPVRKISLTQNYRSTPEILRCAQSVFGKEPLGYERVLEAQRENGRKVNLLQSKDSFSEALFVAKEINRMVGGIDMLDTQALPASSIRRRCVVGGSIGFSDIAILYRTNRQADELERCLLKESIPYVVTGRDEFLTDPQVCYAVAFFRFLLNPEDLISLRLCLKQMDGLSARLIPTVLERYASAGKDLSSLTAILEETAPTSGDAYRLMELLRKYEPLAAREKPQKLIQSWIDDNALSELASMEMLLNTSVMHDGMSAFLQNLALGREADVARSGGKHYSPDAVSLMTLHGAKGLEFPVVFLCGITEGMIPFRNRDGSINREEERRLFYVGMTRAKDELVMLTSPVPSPFLRDLPEELLLKENVPERKQETVSRQFSFLDLL